MVKKSENVLSLRVFEIFMYIKLTFQSKNYIYSKMYHKTYFYKSNTRDGMAQMENRKHTGQAN